jgi:hypothetical protein
MKVNEQRNDRLGRNDNMTRDREKLEELLVFGRVNTISFFNLLPPPVENQRLYLAT